MGSHGGAAHVTAAAAAAGASQVAGGRVRGRVGRQRQTVDAAFLGFTYESYEDTRGRGRGGAHGSGGQRRHAPSFSKTQFLQAK